jgi:hypothetical protein
MVNEGDGWLNALFRAEYGHWYGYVLPAYQRAEYAIPMAGTTCFFRREVLASVSERRREEEAVERSRAPGAAPATTVNGRRVERADGGIATLTDGTRPWDPENVTEDFELDHRLYTSGHRLDYLDATTVEESPPELNEWIRQRTRWKKGKLYTFREYLRDPPTGWRAKCHLYWQSLPPHPGPVNVVGVVLLLVFANLAAFDPGGAVEGVLLLGFVRSVLMTAFYTLGYWSASDAALPTRIRRSAGVALLTPVYWLLQWGGRHAGPETAVRGVARLGEDRPRRPRRHTRRGRDLHRQQRGLALAHARWNRPPGGRAACVRVGRGEPVDRRALLRCRPR